MTGRKFYGILPLIFFLFFLIIGSDKAAAADVSLAWDPSISSNISGYRLYIGSSSRSYGAPIQLGNQTAHTVTGLAAGTWYFSVTAFDVNGNESGFSNEVSTVISGSIRTCDFNRDGTTNISDLQLLANAILGAIPSSSDYDLNGNSMVDTLDLQILNNVILGLRSCP